jgi:hypothetical protein
MPTLVWMCLGSANTTVRSTSIPLLRSFSARRRERSAYVSQVLLRSRAQPTRYGCFRTSPPSILFRGQAEIVVGRGSFVDSFPLFGLQLEDYGSLSAKKLDLLLKIRENERVPLVRQTSGCTDKPRPRPVQNPLPIWLGVGWTPKSFDCAAGQLAPESSSRAFHPKPSASARSRWRLREATGVDGCLRAFSAR